MSLNYKNDAAYIRTCNRFGITPNAFDYDDYRREVKADAPEPDPMERDFE